MYFFCAWPILWVVVNYANNKIFALVEWLCYRDAITYLDRCAAALRSLVFMCLVLPWFVVCFWTLWCDNGGCEQQGEYKRATDIVWKLLVCITLFTLANFLKSFVTKLLSTHFYRTAHFKKVKDAIEKEYYLLMLSQPRPAKPAPALAEPALAGLSLGHLAGYTSVAAGAAGSVASGGSHMLDKLRRITLDRGESGAGAAGDAAGFRARFRAKSFSTTELEAPAGGGQDGLKPLASKSVNLSATASHRQPPAGEAQPGARAAAASGAAAAPACSPGWRCPPLRGRGALTQQQQLQWLAQMLLLPMLLLPGPVAGSAAAPAAHVELAHQGLGKGQQQQQAAELATADPPTRRRWGWWRRVSSQQERLLGPRSPNSAEQHAIAIRTGSSPPSANAAAAAAAAAGPAQQQVASRTGSVIGSVNSPFAAARAELGGGASVRTLTQDSAGAAAAGGVERSKPSGALRGSAGGKSVGRDGKDGGSGAPGLGRTVSLAPGGGVSDPLLQAGMLEKVNVLGKQVDAASMRPGEWERLRTGIALKTFTALMKRYQHMSAAEEAKKLREARRFAKGLFYNVRGDASRPCLIREDFSPFFDSPAMADQAFTYFDKDNDAQLTVREMKDSVTAVFKERKNMAHSLKDTHSIVATLEAGIGFLFHFVFAAIYLLVWGMDIVKGFSTFSATVLALTFVFGNSVRQIYESMLFLFVEHAFDVGDLLELEAVTYRVKKIDLQFIVLVKSTGELVYYPTTRLITLPVINLTRSTARSEKVLFLLDVGKAATSAREALLECVRCHYEENESDFNSCPSVNFLTLLDPFKVQLMVLWTYNFGPEEFKRTSTVKTGLIQAVSDCLGSLDSLEYTLVKANEFTSGSKDAAAAAHEMLASGRAAGVGQAWGRGWGRAWGRACWGPTAAR
ncbi:Mechanosensitive ion channel-domain-containing protein [Scenedesmus sp. NREL 46B-D3]|nr:Mechanosensitive ion channel-domain-containing protein [Scenedesmus sp. NREL 46B-D3]